MQIIPVKTPKLVKHVLPSLIWNIETNEKVIYLTFDDGPTPEITEWTLRTLEAFHAKATFFCIGDNIDKHPEIFQLILKKEHAVGNHTYNHLKGWKRDTQTYIDNTLKAQESINKQVLKSAINNHESTSLNLFRPPYGRIKSKQIKEISKLNYQIIMWNVLSKDWDSSVSKEKCLENVIKKTQSGDIVVFHDSVKASRNMQHALPRMLEYFTEKGFKFKRIPELNQ
ncbi:MAG: polysaccharide deacetylase family protein [Flavobacteriaceae bacterium]|nr:polysaccharide deacetylase family protein [Flavobacteriaceae bacterium]